MAASGAYSILTNDRIRLYALLIISIVTIPVRTQHPALIFNPPKSYYLALGDSVTYGFQSFKFQVNLPPSAYNTGYVLGARLQQIRPGIVTVNDGCPGESTETFNDGGLHLDANRASTP